MFEEKMEFDPSVYGSPILPFRATSRAASPVSNGGDTSSLPFSPTGEPVSDIAFGPSLASPTQLKVGLGRRVPFLA
jgi:hypothetical protein